MAEFIKAYCDRAKQYFGLRVETIDGRPVVTDFYDIESSDAKKVGSTIDAPGIEVAGNLRGCIKCQNREVGHCDCFRTGRDCAAGQGYRYQCVFCDQLRVFTKAEGSEAADLVIKPGQTVSMVQGQEVPLCPAGAGALELIRVGVGWDISDTTYNMDVDSSVILKGASRSTKPELVYYGHKDDEAHSIHHEGDNLVGGKGNAEDSENINVWLKKVPDKFTRIYFVLNIYECVARGQNFGSVRNLYIRLKNGMTQQVLVEYRERAIDAAATGFIIGEACRSGGQWVFRAIGKPVSVTSVLQLAQHCKD